MSSEKQGIVNNSILFDTIQGKIADTAKVPPFDVKWSTLLVEDLKLDSLDLAELSMTLETEFNITISDDAAIELKTVGDVVRLIGQELSLKKV